jgi:hypothetical protein
MATPKKNTKKDAPELTEHEAEGLVFEAFKRSGAFLPQTPEEVAAAETEMEEARIELPLSLRDPMAILKKAVRSTVVLPFPNRPAVDPEAVENMACAAKHGSDIPPEVLARMEADEQDAKAKRGAGDANQ